MGSPGLGSRLPAPMEWGGEGEPLTSYGESALPPAAGAVAALGSGTVSISGAEDIAVRSPLVDGSGALALFHWKQMGREPGLQSMGQTHQPGQGK